MSQSIILYFKYWIQDSKMKQLLMKPLYLTIFLIFIILVKCETIDEDQEPIPFGGINQNSFSESKLSSKGTNVFHSVNIQQRNNNILLTIDFRGGEDNDIYQNIDLSGQIANLLSGLQGYVVINGQKITVADFIGRLTSSGTSSFGVGFPSKVVLETLRGNSLKFDNSGWKDSFFKTFFPKKSISQIIAQLFRQYGINLPIGQNLRGFQSLDNLNSLDGLNILDDIDVGDELQGSDDDEADETSKQEKKEGKEN